MFRQKPFFCIPNQWRAGGGAGRGGRQPQVSTSGEQLPVWSPPPPPQTRPGIVALQHSPPSARAALLRPTVLSSRWRSSGCRHPNAYCSAGDKRAPWRGGVRGTPASFAGYTPPAAAPPGRKGWLVTAPCLLLGGGQAAAGLAL